MINREDLTEREEKLLKQAHQEHVDLANYEAVPPDFIPDFDQWLENIQTEWDAEKGERVEK